MDSVNTRIDDCAADIAYSLGSDEDKLITIQSYLHQYFGVALTEHARYIDSLIGDHFDYENED